MLAIPALLGEHVTGPYEGQLKPPLEVVVVTLETDLIWNMAFRQHIGIFWNSVKG